MRLGVREGLKEQYIYGYFDGEAQSPVLLCRCGEDCLQARDTVNTANATIAEN